MMRTVMTVIWMVHPAAYQKGAIILAKDTLAFSQQLYRQHGRETYQQYHKDILELLSK